MKTRQKSRDASGILLVCLMWMLSLSSSLHAQTWNINGNVTDEQGEPIIGANVIVEGTTTGMITDLDGNFSLQCPVGSTLKASYIGYLTRTVKVTGNMNALMIILKEDAEILEEVLVVG